MPGRPTVLLSDANVLIDYRDANLSVLTLVSAHIGPVRVVHEVLEEVNDLDIEHANALGIEVVDVPTELLLELDTLPRRLSRQDRLSFLACRENDWICLTNDRLLRSLCEQHEIRLCWGLELMVELVLADALPRETARRTAESIRSANPRHITESVLREFLRKIQ